MKCRRSTYQMIRRVGSASLVATVLAAMTVGTVQAAPLNPAHVPVDAKWLLHIDQEALSDLEVTETLREMYPEITENIHEWFRDRYGFDPQDDMRSLTIMSRDYQRHTGTVLLRTQYDKTDIRSMLRKYDSLKTTDWKGHTLYTITLAKHGNNDAHATHHGLKPAVQHNATAERHDRSGGKQMTVYLGDELIVLASSVPNAKSVLRLLDGDVQSLKDTDSPLIAKAPEGAVIYGAAIELGRLDQYNMLLPLLQQQEQCVYAFGQRDGELFETLTLKAQSKEVAKKTTEVLEGVIAYEQLCAAGSKPLTRLMNNVELTCKGTESRVTWEGDSKLAVEAVHDLAKRIAQWMNMLDMGQWRNGEEQSPEADLAPAQKRLRERRLARRAWLGAMILADGDAGAEIVSIYLDSPADRAGLKVGDRITQIDGDDVSSTQTITQRIAKLTPGTIIDLVVVRGGEELNIEVEVGNLEQFHERLFGKQFRQKFDDFHELFDPDFDGVPENVYSFRIPSGEDDEPTLRELLRGMREELRQFRREFQESNGGDRKSSNDGDTEATQ